MKFIGIERMIVHNSKRTQNIKKLSVRQEASKESVRTIIQTFTELDIMNFNRQEKFLRPGGVSA
jgi:hypothetical protein